MKIRSPISRAFAGAFASLGIAFPSAVWAADAGAKTCYYVNNRVGSDELDGLTPAPSPDGKSGPTATIMAAVAKACAGARIVVANTGLDYRESVSIKGFRKGRADNPLVIDGNGATVSGLVQAAPERWTHVRDDVYSFSNRVGGPDSVPQLTYSGWETRIGDSVYGVMPGFNWMASWSGWPTERQAPEIFFLNGKPGLNVTKLSDLPPGGFFYDHRAKPRCLYFRPPAGARIEDCALELPLNQGVFVTDDYVVVRNLASKYAIDDGFAGFWGIGVVFENCNGSFNCDQGMSLHGTSVTIIDGGLYERNGGCGIADVMSSFTVYRNVVIRDNLIHGALFQGLGHSLINCRIYGNWSPQVNVDGDCVVSVVNCLVAGSIEAGTGAYVGVGQVDPGGGIGIQMLRGRIDHCTIVNCSQGIVALEKASIGNSIIANCAKALVEIRPAAAGSFQMKKTILHNGTFVIGDQKITQDGWTEFAKTAKWAQGNIWADPQTKPPSYALPADSPYLKFGEYERASGAVLPPCPAGWHSDGKEVFIRPPP
jgi:hypothetical protein